MARTVLFEPQDVSLVYVAELGDYLSQITPAPFVLVAGETYVIEVDGREYTRTAYPFDSFAPGTVAVGDLGSDQIILGYVASTDYVGIIGPSAGPFRIGLYQEVEADCVILKDRYGANMTYEGVSAVELVTADGGVQQFVAGEIVEKTVNPDFSEGDMEVVAGAGEFISKILVQQPDTLVPANIAEGVAVAGIIGTLAAGSNAKLASGTFTGNGGNVTVSHGLGVVPDVVMFFTTVAPSDTSIIYLRVGFGFSKALTDAFAANLAQLGLATRKNGSYYYVSVSNRNAYNFIEAETTWPIRQATETEFTVGATPVSAGVYLTAPDANYTWLAIAGLT